MVDLFDRLRYAVYWLRRRLTPEYPPLDFKTWAAFRFIDRMKAEHGKPAPSAEIAYQDITLRQGKDERDVIYECTPWTVINTGIDEPIARMAWPSPDRIYLATGSGKVYMSDDGGLTFVQVSSGEMPSLALD